MRIALYARFEKSDGDPREPRGVERQNRGALGAGDSAPESEGTALGLTFLRAILGGQGLADAPTANAGVAVPSRFHAA